MAKKTLVVIVLIILSLSLLGCQTVQGIGKDITWSGEKGAEIMER